VGAADDEEAGDGDETLEDNAAADVCATGDDLGVREGNDARGAWDPHPALATAPSSRARVRRAPRTRRRPPEREPERATEAVDMVNTSQQQ
jgi:hypothetical protein